jgi:hypothetical protein
MVQWLRLGTQKSRRFRTVDWNVGFSSYLEFQTVIPNNKCVSTTNLPNPNVGVQPAGKHCAMGTVQTNNKWIIITAVRV